MRPKYSSTSDSGRFNLSDAVQRTRIANELAEINFNLAKQNDFLGLIAYALSCKLETTEKLSAQLSIKGVQERK